MLLAHASISEKFFHCAHILSGVPIKMADSLDSALALDDGDKESAMLFVSLFCEIVVLLLLTARAAILCQPWSHDLSAELFSAARPIPRNSGW